MTDLNRFHTTLSLATLVLAPALLARARPSPARAGDAGLTVLAPTRLVEWGRGWLDLEPEREGAPPVRSGGSYVTIWERQTDGHWRIVRNMAF